MTGVQLSIVVGVALALAQATMSVAVLKWAWKRPSFFNVWALSTLARFLVFGLTAFIVHQHTRLDLAATLVSLALATMGIMILEISLFLTPKK